MPIASMWGTSVGYTESSNSVEIEKNDGNVAVVHIDIFNCLYRKLDGHTAALKDDCIEYVEFMPGTEIDKPIWFYEYFTDVTIIPEDAKTVLYYDDGTLPITVSRKSLMEFGMDDSIHITSHCVILRNKYGELRGLEYDEFFKFYDTVGE